MLKQVRLSRDKRRGFTLTEIAIVLGIIGLILGAIWAAASAVYNNLRVAKAQQELIQISQAIRAMYAARPIMDTTASTVNLALAGIFPADMTVGGGTAAFDPWGGDVTVIPANVVTTTGDGFVITFGKTNGQIPSKTCVDLVTAISNNTDQTLVGVSKTAETVVKTGVPTTATAIQGVCAAPGQNGPLAFTYRLR